MLDWLALLLLAWTVLHGCAVWFEIVWVLEGGCSDAGAGVVWRWWAGWKKLFDWFLKAVS